MSDSVSIGNIIKKMLGIYYRPVIGLYRALFMDYNEYNRLMLLWVPSKKGLKILDLGCGEGLFTEMLADAYPDAYITGLDISSSVGKMFRKKCDRVSFICDSLENFALSNSADFDLVIINDVIHHVAADNRKELLTNVKKILKNNGKIIIKDWARTKTLVNLFAYFMDRHISNSPTYFSADFELRTLLHDVFGCNCIKEEVRIRPCRNNIVFFVNV